jgi:hypothetical protein
MATFARLVRSFLLRELHAVRLELLAYPDESAIWVLPQGLPNSAGTLALHLAGNLQHYVGALLGGTGYVRRRDAEFSTRDLTRGQLLAEIDAAEQVVRATLGSVAEERIGLPFPQPLRERPLRTDEALMHLAAHLAYHLGQINYHRRVVTGQAHGVGAMNPDELGARG